MDWTGIFNEGNGFFDLQISHQSHQRFPSKLIPEKPPPHPRHQLSQHGAAPCIAGEGPVQLGRWHGRKMVQQTTTSTPSPGPTCARQHRLPRPLDESTPRLRGCKVARQLLKSSFLSSHFCQRPHVQLLVVICCEMLLLVVFPRWKDLIRSEKSG